MVQISEQRERERKVEQGLCRAQAGDISGGEVFEDKTDSEPEEYDSKDQRGRNRHANV